ncbi:hypothetical protein J7421_16305, partial [Xanthomonas phaseoli pv. dieffenbachiae]|uniref:hypothetical protein n=1 Tax=Xanthomonas phaseoli TaxID=1985254 RepID=UPI001ADA2415
MLHVLQVRAVAIQSTRSMRAAQQLVRRRCFLPKLFCSDHFPSRGDVAMIAGSQQRGAIAQLG